MIEDNFSHYKSMQNLHTLNDCIFHILRYSATKLHNAIKSIVLFPAVVMNFPNSKVSLKGERSIVAHMMTVKK